MPESMHKQLRAIGELLHLDCGDNSCLASGKKGGMRTNGGCRCDFVEAVRELDRKNRRIVDEWNRMNDAQVTLQQRFDALQDENIGLLEELNASEHASSE